MACGPSRAAAPAVPGEAAGRSRRRLRPGGGSPAPWSTRVGTSSPRTRRSAITPAMTTLAMVEELRGNLGRALQLIGEGVRLADDSPRREGHQDPLHVVQGSILMELDRLQDARSTLQAGMRVSEELGAHWHLPFYEAYLAMERFQADGWDDASAELDAALQLVAATGERHSLVLIESLSSLIALHRATSGTPRR